MDSVRRAGARGREPLLIVPTRADAEYYLRELAGDGVAAGIRVERFEGLIREAVARAGTGGPRLEGIARERVLCALALRAGARRPTPGYLAALGELFAELQMRRIGAGRFVGALASWAATDGEDPARARLGRIYSDYSATLERLGRPDAELQAVRALDALRERPSRWGGRPVLFYGFDDLTPLQLDAIETLGRVVDAEVTVSLAYEPGRIAFAARAGVFQELLPLAEEVRRRPPAGRPLRPPVATRPEPPRALPVRGRSGPGRGGGDGAAARGRRRTGRAGAGCRRGRPPVLGGTPRRGDRGPRAAAAARLRAFARSVRVGRRAACRPGPAVVRRHARGPWPDRAAAQPRGAFERPAGHGRGPAWLAADAGTARAGGARRSARGRADAPRAHGRRRGTGAVGGAPLATGAAGAAA